MESSDYGGNVIAKYSQHCHGFYEGIRFRLFGGTPLLRNMLTNLAALTQ